MAVSECEKKKYEYMRKPTKLMELRLNSNLSQLETATEIGLSRIHYGNIEKGIFKPSCDLAEKISKHFNLKSIDIFKAEKDGIHMIVKK